MIVPGSNLLNYAFFVIAKTPVQYYKFLSRTLNDYGLWDSIYEDPIVIRGSLQPVERSLYAELGLDLNKKYMDLFVSNDVIDVNRDVSGDQFIFNSEVYQCESSEPWFDIDGWNAIHAVRVPLTPIVASP